MPELIDLATATETPPPTENQLLFAKIRTIFPGATNFKDPYGLLTVEIGATDVVPLITFLKEELGFQFLTDLCGMHFPGGHKSHPSEWGLYVNGPAVREGSGSAVERGTAGPEIPGTSQSVEPGAGSSYSAGSAANNAYDQGFEQAQAQVQDAHEAHLRGEQPIPKTKGELGVVYHLHALASNIRIRVKTFFEASKPEVDTLTGLFKGANWMERETYDFYGIIFRGHPDLRRILNVDEMIAFPMRKEFPLEDQHRKDKQDQFFGR